MAWRGGVSQGFLVTGIRLQVIHREIFIALGGRRQRPTAVQFGEVEIRQTVPARGGFEFGSLFPAYARQPLNRPEVAIVQNRVYKLLEFFAGDHIRTVEEAPDRFKITQTIPELGDDQLGPLLGECLKAVFQGVLIFLAQIEKQTGRQRRADQKGQDCGSPGGGCRVTGYCIANNRPVEKISSAQQQYQNA